MKINIRKRGDDNKFVTTDETCDLPESFDVFKPSDLSQPQIDMLLRNTNDGDDVDSLIEALGIAPGVDLLKVVDAIGARNSANAKATRQSRDASADQVRLAFSYFTHMGYEVVRSQKDIFFVWRKAMEQFDGEWEARVTATSEDLHQVIEAFKRFYRVSGQADPFAPGATTPARKESHAVDDAEEPF